MARASTPCKKNVKFPFVGIVEVRLFRIRMPFLGPSNHDRAPFL